MGSFRIPTRISRSSMLIMGVVFIIVFFSLFSIGENDENGRYSVTHLPDGSPDQQSQNEHTGTLENIKHSIEDVTRELLEPAEQHQLQPCTIINSYTNQFYDLKPLGGLGVDGETQAWNAKGFDYGRNFSIGICFTPLRQLNSLTNLDFKDSSNRTNIGAYYTNQGGDKVSIGEVSTDLKFRGNKLVLEYENGDICSDLQNSKGEPLKKSTLLSFTCDREISKKARVNYLGAFNNCSYHFEVRTIHACATSNDVDDDDVWWIFLGVVLAALVVYLGANKVYAVIKNHYESKIKKEMAIV